MKDGARAAAWCGLWFALLAGLLAIVLQSLRIGTDLRLFLPQPRSPEQALVLDGIGEGPAARLLMVALQGDRPAKLAELSHALAAALRRLPEFRLVANGSGNTPPWLTEYRYLLTPGLDAGPLDAPRLRAALEERLQDLASPAGSALESLVPADPTLEVAAAASQWAPRRPPRTIDGAWFDAAGVRALLVVETRAAGFDPDRQQRALGALDEAFRAARGESAARLTVTGPGRFSALMKERTERETVWLGSVATLGLAAVLIVAYRRWRVPALAPLPLAAAALAGLAAVGAVHGEVHGITLVFGFTLIGVAQDYPIHYFSHQRPGLSPLENARQLWPALATGVAATCIAYVTFLASGVTGLTQLGLFSITGLAVAGLTTRWFLPRTSGANFRDPAQSKALARVERFATLPHLPPAAYAAAFAACVAVAWLAPAPAWQDDLGALTPVPAAMLAEDAALRSEIGAPDPRYLAVAAARDAESVLQALETLEPGLEALAASGAISDYAHAARIVPSVRRQRERQARLPAPQDLAAELAAATAGLPFRDGVFAPFLTGVARSRGLDPLTPARLRATEQAQLIDGLLRDRDGGVQGIIAFSGIADPAQLREWADGARPGVRLIDLKNEALALTTAQRARILACLAAAAVLLLAVVAIALRSARRIMRVIAPMALTTAAVVAALRAVGVPLDLFHLISLVLAAGLGIDYALYFERTGGDRDERLRTLHAVLVCSASTLMVFVLLSFSSLPVLRSIGITVTLGVVFNFLLALAMPRTAASPG